MVVVGRALWRSSGLSPLFQQGHLEPVARVHVQIAFEYLHGWKLYNLPGHPVLVLGHRHGKKCLLMFRGNLLYFSLCPLAVVLSLSTMEKSLAPSSLHPPFRYLLTLMRPHWAFSSPDRTVPALSLSSVERCSRPLIIFMALHWTLSSMSMSLLHWRAHSWTLL